MILVLVLILWFLMLLIGGERGGKSFAVLILNTVIGLISVFLLGYNVNAPLVFCISCILFSIITIFYQNGYQLKTVASFFATAAVFLVISICIYIFCILGHITGFNEIQQYEESSAYIGSAVNVKMLLIFAIGIIWGELGAIIDTSISISSVQNEVAVNNPDSRTASIVRSGLMVGKDILGTTINTLTFVAIGEAIMLCLYYINYHYSVAELLNSKSFFQELAVILFSCIGCVLIIPVTAVIFPFLLKSEKIVDYFQKRERARVEQTREKSE